MRHTSACTDCITPLLRFELNFERVPSRIIEKVRRLKDVEQKNIPVEKSSRDGNFEIDSTCDRAFDKFWIGSVWGGCGICCSKQQQAKVNKY